MRVLIVDDNPCFAEAARDLLEREGIRVVAIAATRAEALDRAAVLEPDLALVDIDLGDDSGFELARQLAGQALRAQSPVILISAYPEEDLGELVEASPAIGFLSKSDLSFRAISALLRRSRDG